MKPASESYESRVILKQGDAVLATWSQHFDRAPTAGEAIAFASHARDLHHLHGYRPEGHVIRVKRGAGIQDSLVEIEALPPEKVQERVTLNSSLIPGSLHLDAERLIRRTLPDAHIAWQASDLQNPLADYQDFVPISHLSPEDAHRPRSDTFVEKAARSMRVTLEAQLRQMLTRSREVLAHF